MQFIPPAQRRALGHLVEEDSAKNFDALRSALRSDEQVGRVTISAEGQVRVDEAPVLELLFTVYMPPHLGLIDYHSPHRAYGREQVASVNLSVSSTDERSRNHALYNTQGKYSNIKAEMASAYVRETLAERAGSPLAAGGNLIKTLQELFEVFFPGKTFLGPRPTPDGALLFPVRLTNGKEHDIDDLSSGEKEVLLGYLRLRDGAPRNSVILLDEPELHLNPRLIKGLPRFYQKHLGDVLGNQIWMITHSDTLLREAVEDPAYAVFHMQPALTAADNTRSQAQAVSARGQLDRAIIDLVGDLATYSPRSKTVIVEGGGNSDVDVRVISDLFPEFDARVNLVSAGNKRAVGELHALLEKTSVQERLGYDFYSIVDRDFGDSLFENVERRYQWDVYHVENYLLHTPSMLKVVSVLDREAQHSESSVDAMLQACAAETVDGLVKEKLEQHTHQLLWSAVRLGCDPRATDLAAQYRLAAERSAERISNLLSNNLDVAQLRAFEQSHRARLSSALQDGTWRREFRGRDIMKRFTAKAQLGVQYEAFRNLVVGQMRLDGVRPPGMQTVLDRILTA